MHHVVFPHIDVWGFCYLVLYPPPRPPAHPPTHSLTHTLTHSPTHSPTHPLTHSLIQSFTQCAFCVAGVAQSALPRGRMYALASLGSPPFLRGRRGTICTAKGSDVRPGVPWVSASFAWQAWHNLHCQGVGCTPWRPLGLRLFCVAGVAQCALPRGRMYALASLGSPPLLRGRRGTMCTAKGSDVRPGVPWVSASFAWQAWHNVHCQRVGCTPWRPLGLRLFCVAGVAQCALPRGRMYALASLGSPPLLRGRRGTMCTANGVGCTPWRHLGLRLFCAAGVGQCALPRGRMYALASLGSPPLLRGRRGTMCTAKGVGCTPWPPLGYASFAWQAWGNVHCQGVGCTPWRPLGSASFAWQVWDNVHFAWQAWDNVHCQGIGCTAWSPLGSASFAWQAWDNVHFAWQAWDNVHCQGGWMYALASLGLRFFCVAGVGQCAFCVAGVGQCALPRGWSTPWRPLGSASFAWQALTHSLTQSLTLSLYSLPHTHSHSLTRSISLTNTLSLTYSLTH